VGFIGTGVIFDLNILGYLGREDIEITSLCNRTISKAEKKKAKFDLKSEMPLYSDYNKMLENEDLDIVEILLPHHLHAEATIKAAKSRVKAISCQKPIATSLKEADQMIEACKDTNTLLSIYENFIFAPHIQKAKELIKNDYIGDLTSIRIKIAMAGKGGWDIPAGAKSWRKEPDKVGGNPDRGSPVLFDNGWHAFSLAWWLFEEKIEKVFAWTGNYKGIDAPAYVMFKYENGKKHVVPPYGNMEFALMPDMKIPSDYYPTDEFIEIIGTRGMMKINQGTSIGNIMTKYDAFSPISIVRDGKVEQYNDFQLENDWKSSFINATNYFIDIVKNGGTPILSGEDARYILKFNLAAIKSADIGKEIQLKSND
jgi:predicted dehydrogenase